MTDEMEYIMTIRCPFCLFDMDELGVVREIKVVSVVGTQLCELGRVVGCEDARRGRC